MINYYLNLTYLLRRPVTRHE